MAMTVVDRGRKYTTERDPAWPARVYRTTFTVGDSNFRDGAGNWQPVDETILDDLSVPGFVAAADKQQHAVRFGSGGERRWYPRRNVPGEYVETGKPDFWRVQGGGSWRPWNLTGLTRGSNTVAWGTADYLVAVTNYWGGTKLDYQLTTPSAPSRVRFPLTLVGLTLEADGTLRSIADQTIVGRISTPSAEDANGDPVAVSQSYTGGHIELTVTPGAAVYPIRVDPTFTDGYGGDVFTGKDTQVRSGAPQDDYNYGIYTTPSDSTARKLLIQFDLSSIPSTATCDSATFTIHNGGTAVAATHTVYSIASGNSGWVEGTVNAATETGSPCWNWKEYNTVAWAGSAGLSTAGTDYESSSVGSFTSAAGDAADLEYSTALTAARVAGWFGASNTNYGLVILSSSSSSQFFKGAENATTGSRPALVVNYTLAAEAGPSLPPGGRTLVGVGL